MIMTAVDAFSSFLAVVVCTTHVAAGDRRVGKAIVGHRVNGLNHRLRQLNPAFIAIIIIVVILVIVYFFFVGIFVFVIVDSAALIGFQKFHGSVGKFLVAQFHGMFGGTIMVVVLFDTLHYLRDAFVILAFD